MSISAEQAGLGSFVVTGEAINSTSGNSSSNGVMIAVDTADGKGYEADASVSTHQVVGVCFDKVASAGTAFAKKGVYRITNSTSSPVVAADTGKVCYVEDASTVAHAGTNSIVAGTVMSVDSLGVMVWVGVKAPVA